MSLDNYQLEVITQEIGKNLVTERVGRVYEPERFSLAIGFRNGMALYISVNPARPALFLTSRSQKQLEGEAGNFTNLLRKYISSAQLTAIQKQPGERRVELTFQSYDVAGSLLYITLLVELTGRSANLHLYAGDVCLSSLREGFQKDPERIREVANNQTLSPLLSKELAYRSALDPEHALESLRADMKNIQPTVYHPESERIGLLEPGKNLLLSAFKLEMAKGLKAKLFESMSAAAEFYYSRLEALQEYRRRRSQTLGRLKTEISRLETLISRLKSDIADFDKSLEYRRLGELILANLSTLSQKDNKIYLIDLYDSSQREIELEIAPNTTPQQAAAQLFKEYQRGRRGHRAASERLLEIERELVEKQQEYKRVAEEFESEHFKPQAKPEPKSRKRELGLTGIRRYLSSDGFEILVGRSDAGNEELTFKIARPSDIWLHTADYPGAHVLVRNPARVAVPHKTLYEAAQLAAYFSKAKGEANAAVRYCERKMLSRPKKAKAGLVLMQQYKTLMVAPLEAGIRQP